MSDKKLPSVLDFFQQQAVEAQQASMEAIKSAVPQLQQLDAGLIQQTVTNAEAAQLLRTQDQLALREYLQSAEPHIETLQKAERQLADIESMPPAISNLLVLLGQEEYSGPRQRQKINEASRALELRTQRFKLEQQTRQAQLESLKAAQETAKSLHSALSTSVQNQLTLSQSFASQAREAAQLLLQFNQEKREEFRHQQEVRRNNLGILNDEMLAKLSETAEKLGSAEALGFTYSKREIESEVRRRQMQALEFKRLRAMVERDVFEAGRDIEAKTRGDLLSTMRLPELEKLVESNGVIDLGDGQEYVIPIAEIQQHIIARKEARSQSLRFDTETSERVAQNTENAIRLQMLPERLLEIAQRSRTLFPEGDTPREASDQIRTMQGILQSLQAEGIQLEPSVLSKRLDRLDEGIEKIVDLSAKALPEEESLVRAWLQGLPLDAGQAVESLIRSVATPTPAGLPEGDPRAAAMEAGALAALEYLNRTLPQGPIDIFSGTPEERQEALFLLFQQAASSGQLKTTRPELQRVYTQKAFEVFKNERIKAAFQLALNMAREGRPQDPFRSQGIDYDALLDYREGEDGRTIAVFNPEVAMAKLSGLKDPETGQRLSDVLLQIMESDRFEQRLRQMLGGGKNRTYRAAVFDHAVFGGDPIRGFYSEEYRNLSRIAANHKLALQMQQNQWKTLAESSYWERAAVAARLYADMADNKLTPEEQEMLKNLPPDITVIPRAINSVSKAARDVIFLLTEAFGNLGPVAQTVFGVPSLQNPLLLPRAAEQAVDAASGIFGVLVPPDAPLNPETRRQIIEQMQEKPNVR